MLSEVDWWVTFSNFMRYFPSLSKTGEMDIFKGKCNTKSLMKYTYWKCQTEKPAEYQTEAWVQRSGTWARCWLMMEQFSY